MIRAFTSAVDTADLTVQHLRKLADRFHVRPDLFMA